MVRVRDDSEKAFSTRPSNSNFGSKYVILPVHVSMLANFGLGFPAYSSYKCIDCAQQS